MSSRILPREGLTLEALVAPIRLTALQPIFTGPLLFLLLKYPEHAGKYLPAQLQGQTGLTMLSSALKVLLGLGLLRKVSHWLTRKTLNRFSTDNTWDWRREVVIVTGGCSGIGELTVRLLAKHSIKVVALDINPPKTPLPSNAFYYHLDVTSSKDIHTVAEKIRQEVGNPTVLVNNAGIGTGKAILKEEEAAIRRTFEINVVAHFLLVQEFLPYMIEKNHGHIVTIASLASFLVHARNVDYASSKAAALAFHEGLSAELKDEYKAPKVRTTVVHPTWVNTPLIQLLKERPGGFRDFTLAPETVAEAIVSQILKGESAQLILPARFGWSPSIRAWPGWLQDTLRNTVADLLPR